MVILHAYAEPKTDECHSEVRMLSMIVVGPKEYATAWIHFHLVGILVERQGYIRIFQKQLLFLSWLSPSSRGTWRGRPQLRKAPLQEFLVSRVPPLN